MREKVCIALSIATAVVTHVKMSKVLTLKNDVIVVFVFKALVFKQTTYGRVHFVKVGPLGRHVAYTHALDFFSVLGTQISPFLLKLLHTSNSKTVRT